MKKHFRKLISMMLVVIMALSMNAAAFAADNGSITVNGTTDGKTYEIYKIFDMTANSDYSNVAYTIDSDWTAFFNGAGASYIVDSNSGSLNAINVGGETKYINITEDNVAEFSQVALAYAATVGNDGSQVATGTSVEFTGLALGYYLVYPKGATDVTTGNASIASLTSTKPAATVNVKADYPTIDKEVDDISVEIGQTVTYTITGQVPDTTGYTSYTYKVEDTMDAGLTFDSSTANWQITIGGTAVTANPTYTANGFELEFDMTQYQDQVGEEVVIKYSAVVNENAINGVNNDGNTTNSATLTYSDDPKSNTTTTTEPDEEKVYVAGIQIDKYDGSDEDTKLDGAEFVLKNADGKFYKFADNKVTWVDDEADATTVTTDTDGKAFFKGLENGTYSLKETKAPEGFNLLSEEVSVTVNYENQTADVYQVAGVANNAGTELPNTGGMGTTLFYVVGAALILGAGFMLVSRKRVNGK